MDSAIIDRFRKAVREWDDARTAWRVTAVDLTRHGPSVGRVGQRHYFDAYIPCETEGEALAQASHALAEAAVACGLPTRPALVLCQRLRRRGYREVPWQQIHDTEILAEEVALLSTAPGHRISELAAAEASKPRGRRPRQRRSGAEIDAQALVLAERWDKEARTWTVTMVANALGVDRSQLTGRNQKDGTYRSPLFKRYHDATMDNRERRRMATAKRAVVGRTESVMTDDVDAIECDEL
ncbi:MAG: hypothetical protein U1E73_02980 [Planctomycetota bacterium]